MLSLSLFSSSQTISLAIFNNKKTNKIRKKKKIVDNKTKEFLYLLEKCLSKFNIKKFSNIYFLQVQVVLLL